MGAKGLTGGCLCGAVRYRVEAVAEPATVCHCRMCQKAGGGPFMAYAPVALADFALTTGALNIFRSSEIAERGSCGTCGSPLTYRRLASDGISVSLGSLDDPEAVAVTEQLAAEQMLNWLKPSLETPNLRLDDWLQSIQAPKT